MSQTHTIKQLQQTVKNLESIDRQQLFRPNLGEESLKGVLKPKFEEVLKDAQFALMYSYAVADVQVQNMVGILDQLYQVFDRQANLQSADYITEKENVRNQINDLQEKILDYQPGFVTAAIKRKGLLEDEGIQNQYNKTIESLQKKANETLESTEKRAQEILKEAKSVADEIEQRAKHTAAHISVEEAQRQFREAQIHHEKQVKLWCWISVASGICFVGCVVFLWLTSESDVQGGWLTFYYSTLRIALLGAFGAFTTFCLRTLRAHMHMRERNLHRQRIANSIPSFVDSVVNHDQRDMILAQLVDAVAAFGSSGLLGSRDDFGSPPKLAVDSVLRNITSSAPKS